MSEAGRIPQASPFVFDRVFAEKPFKGEFVLPELPPPTEDAAPQYSAGDVETARQLAFEEGMRRGRDEGRVEGIQLALSEAEQKTNAAFAAAAEQFGALAGRQDDMFQALAQDCERLVQVILDRLLPELVRRGGAEEILGVVRTALAIACNDPVVEVRVPHDIVEGIRPRIARLTRDLAFRGRVDLLGDSYLTEGMVRVRWMHGGAQRDPAQMLTEIATITARILEREGAPSDAPIAGDGGPTED